MSKLVKRFLRYQFFQVQCRQLPPSWISEIIQILLAEVVQRAETHIIPNLSKTGQYTLLQFFNFSKWRQLPS